MDLIILLKTHSRNFCVVAAVVTTAAAVVSSSAATVVALAVVADKTLTDRRAITENT